MATLKDNKVKINQETSLKIVKKGQKTLSKNQQLFNTLTKRIEKLEVEIKNDTEKLNRILNNYTEKLEPLFKEVGNIRFKLAMSLGNTTFRFKYTPKQLDNIRDIIVDLCKDAFVHIEPDPAQEEFYDLWADISYQEELSDQFENTKDIFADMLKEMHGININFEGIDINDNNFFEIQKKVMEEFEKSKQQQEDSSKKKTKKELQNEARQKAEEELKNRSLRSIYIALAKVIHPDTETDLNLKAEKEEIMKQVTSAYDKKDLPALLKLELEWVNKESEHLEKLSEEKLSIYISALKQQVEELEKEKNMLYMNPRYISIMDMIQLSEKSAMKQIKELIVEQNQFKKMFANDIHAFDYANSKKIIIDFIKDYREIMLMKNVFDNLMNTDFDDFFGN